MEVFSHILTNFDRKWLEIVMEKEKLGTKDFFSIFVINFFL